MNIKPKYLNFDGIQLKVNAFSYYVSKNKSGENINTLEYSKFLPKYKSPWNYTPLSSNLNAFETMVLLNWKRAIVNCINDQRALGKNPILIFPPTKPATTKKDNQVFFLLNELIGFTKQENRCDYIELKTSDGTELKNFPTLQERKDFLSSSIQTWEKGRVMISGDKNFENAFFIFVDDILLNGIMYKYVLEGYSLALKLELRKIIANSRGFFIAKGYSSEYPLEITIDGNGLEEDSRITALLNQNSPHK